jgi:hypothetical protein
LLLEPTDRPAAGDKPNHLTLRVTSVLTNKIKGFMIYAPASPVRRRAVKAGVKILKKK